MLWDPEALDSLDDAAIGDVLQSWASFCGCNDALLCGRGDLSAGADLVPLVAALCGYGLCSLVQDHFLHSLEEAFKSNAVLKFWKHFDAFSDASKLGTTDFQCQVTQFCIHKSFQKAKLKGRSTCIGQGS
ncbi:Anaphase promoting complex (APC) subunit 2 [Musa troglodytarum]|uniref:Anaphase promoting complex (APC) subunit 2 n=1 Tax=Musa troglodytarum TaxID=320322 RepID=A0A9E7JD41_9LILI|nr:Anaphase promoting complex (APC) subunit 2 [Musa troglodytarum]